MKGGGNRSDKLKMEGRARVSNGQQGDNSQMDQGRAQGVSEVGQRVGAKMEHSQRQGHKADVWRPRGRELGKANKVVE